MINVFKDGIHSGAVPVHDLDLVLAGLDNEANQSEIIFLLNSAKDLGIAELQSKIDKLNEGKIRLIDDLAGKHTDVRFQEIQNSVRGMVHDTNILKSEQDKIRDSVGLVIKILGELVAK